MNTYKNAKYMPEIVGQKTIEVEINGNFCFVPTDPANTDYAEIMRQVEAGELTIAPADEEE